MLYEGGDTVRHRVDQFHPVILFIDWVTLGALPLGQRFEALARRPEVISRDGASGTLPSSDDDIIPTNVVMVMQGGHL